jgi:regulator of protease activity HflC (stomatin/prohibitin superfamily)
MRWTLVVMTLGFFGLVGYYLNLKYRTKKMEASLKKTFEATKQTALMILISITLSGCIGCEQVDEGYRGIKSEFGKVVEEPKNPGLHWYNPFTSSIDEIDVRERKMEGTTSAFTSDTQGVQINYAVTYYPDPIKIGDIFKQFGEHFETRMALDKAIESAIKDTTGRVKADDLVKSRETVRKDAEKELKDSFIHRGVIVTKLELANLDFDDAYEAAVEAKVVAVQKAAEAKNVTVRIEEEARQTVMTAKAESESMRIKSQALAQNKGLIEFEIAKKWDGKLPEIMMGSSSIPMINLDSLKKKHE